MINLSDARGAFEIKRNYVLAFISLAVEDMHMQMIASECFKGGIKRRFQYRSELCILIGAE